MANTVNYAVKYMNMLDRIYKEVACTANLTPNARAYKFDSISEKTVYIKKIALQGLGDYSRTTGYDSGDITIEWEAHTFSKDRSKKFNIDTQDAKEAYTTIPEVGAEFQRAYVTPELDAYRFGKLVTEKGGITVSADLDYDTAVAAIDTAVKTMDDAEVPKMNRCLYVSNNMYKLLKESGEFFKTITVSNNNGIINREITAIDDMEIIRVPSARFYSAFTFTASGAGGFTPAGGAKALNFILLYKPVALAVVKHVSPKIIVPEINGDYDGYLYCYRIYHDLFVPDNKVDGIYIHSVA